MECSLTGEQTHDRRAGACYAEGKDIGAAVIAAGYVLDCARHSNGRYLPLSVVRVFWNQCGPKLIESLAHLVGFIMLRAVGDASAALRVSSV